jgi:hypothetical protein
MRGTRMSKQTITLQMAYQDKKYGQEVEADVDGGLAVHHPCNTIDGKADGVGWQITHVASGLRLGKWYDTKREALAVCDRLLDVSKDYVGGGWEQPQEQINAWVTGTAWDRVRAILYGAL